MTISTLTWLPFAQKSFELCLAGGSAFEYKVTNMYGHEFGQL